MNKQRKVVITTTYNEMGIIIDTKAEEVTQTNLQPACNQLATDTISRQAAIDILCSQCAVDKPETCSTIQEGDRWCEEVYTLINMPSAQPEPHWIPVTEDTPIEDGDYWCTFDAETGRFVDWCSWYHGRWVVWLDDIPNDVSNVIAWCKPMEPYKGVTT